MRLVIQRAFSFSSAPPKDTCLRALHDQLKARIVDFAGYNLPVYYPTGIIKEHLHCRTAASIFDVSHMGQLIIEGKDRVKLLQRVTVGSTERRHRTNFDECYLTVFLNEKAGIIDDGIATVTKDHVRIVVNGANKYIVREHLLKVIAKQGYDVNIELQDEKGLIALQGPKSAQILQGLLKNIDLSQAPFMSQFSLTYKGHSFVITRSGYTGEDGFEISSSGNAIEVITKDLLVTPDVACSGLGARDSLRLEAGLCLHGHDISESITPFEAGLMWTVHKRKEGDQRLEFIGEKALKEQQESFKNKTISIRKRQGFVLDSTGIVRQHCKIFNEKGKEVGETTSGGPSPSLKKSIGMAYIASEDAKEGRKLVAQQRNKNFDLTIQKMPIVSSRYYKGWTQFK